MDPVQLQPGDVLLMKGVGELSELIAWCSDSLYSHAAMVSDRGQLIEAGVSGIARASIEDRLKATGQVTLIDARRPLAGDGLPINAEEQRALVKFADQFLGQPFPGMQLALLGVVVAMRGKFPGGRIARKVIKAALDYVIKDDAKHMVCSALVYRSLGEVPVLPAGKFRPRIVLGPRGDTTPPDINWRALLDEVLEIWWPNGIQSMDGGLPPELAEDAAAPDDIALQQARLKALAALGLPADAAMLMSEPFTGMGLVLPNPNAVSPQDLAYSPSMRDLGRLLGSAATKDC